MKIPVFVSCPTVLNKRQNKGRKIILSQLEDLQLEPRALGRGDYPVVFPLREVYSIATHCSGGIILGFAQFETNSGVWKRGTRVAKKVNSPAAFPSPWNELEAGILFGLGLPLLVFREPKVQGAVFKEGAIDLFVHPIPFPPLDKEERNSLKQVFLKWSASVREHYYSAK